VLSRRQKTLLSKELQGSTDEISQLENASVQTHFVVDAKSFTEQAETVLAQSTAVPSNPSELGNVIADQHSLDSISHTSRLNANATAFVPLAELTAQANVGFSPGIIVPQKIPTSALLFELMGLFKSFGSKRCFRVGGEVRDAILNIKRKFIDHDLTGDLPYEVIKNKIAALPSETRSRLYFEYTEGRHAKGRFDDLEFDYHFNQTFLSDETDAVLARKDAMARDFSVNSLKATMDGDVIDGLGYGVKDVLNHQLNVVTEQDFELLSAQEQFDATVNAFSKDPIIAFRGLNFALNRPADNFQLSSTFIHALGKIPKPSLDGIEAGKINFWLKKILDTENGLAVFHMLKSRNVFKKLFARTVKALSRDTLLMFWVDIEIMHMHQYKSLNYIYCLFIFAIAKSVDQNFSINNQAGLDTLLEITKSNRYFAEQLSGYASDKHAMTDAERDDALKAKLSSFIKIVVKRFLCFVSSTATHDAAVIQKLDLIQPTVPTWALPQAESVGPQAIGQSGLFSHVPIQPIVPEWARHSAAAAGPSLKK
jgi:hypothetical protein